MLYPTEGCIRKYVQRPLPGEYSRRQRQKQLPTIVNLDIDKQVKVSSHSSDVYRCRQRSQPRSVESKLLAISGLRAVELALRIDTPEKVNCVVHEMRDITCVLVQKGE
jgi:hypothetical protein